MEIRVPNVEKCKVTAEKEAKLKIRFNWYSDYKYVMTFEIVPQYLDMLDFSLIIFSLCISV